MDDRTAAYLNQHVTTLADISKAANLIKALSAQVEADSARVCLVFIFAINKALNRRCNLSS